MLESDPSPLKSITFPYCSFWIILFQIDCRLHKELFGRATRGALNHVTILVIWRFDGQNLHHRLLFHQIANPVVGWL